jgi:NAD(P)-dependent dehydrogenase (short-subunit alcohol dehydrogenase family)
MSANRSFDGTWGLVLGVSSGFGAATAIELARRGMGIFGVHLDRKSTLASVVRLREEIEASGAGAQLFNVNAADPDRRDQVVESIAAALAASGQGPLRLVMHSLAFGTLKPFIAERADDAVTPAQLEMTLDVMAHSLVYWVQALHHRGLIGRGTRVVAMTSGGGTRVIPRYGAVSAAKAALEAHVRQLAVELAPAGVAVSCIRAGVADTPALRKIPDHERIVEAVRERNPGRRLTEPDDVARVIALLCQSEAAWITGGVIGVDGGEDVVA